MSKGAKTNDRQSLSSLLQTEDVVGVSQLYTWLAFTGQVTCTFVFKSDELEVEVVDARKRWSMASGDEHNPGVFHGRVIRPLSALSHFGPLASWAQLRAAAFAAPTCETPTLDGVCYIHSVLDRQGGIKAHWQNPDWVVHRRQCDLLEAYQALLESSGLLCDQIAFRS